MVPQRRFPAKCFTWFAVLYFICSPLAKGQQPTVRVPQMGGGKSTVTVNVRSPDGTPFDGNAVVNIYNFGGISAAIGEARIGVVQFNNLLEGRYTVEAFAPGYQKLTELIDLSIPGQNIQVFLTLIPESSGPAAPSPSSPLLLAPKAQKELNKAVEAIRENKPNDARKYLEKLSHAAPANPDVNYLWGAYYFATSDWTKAKSYWEKAIQIYPRHAFSLAALAQVALREGDLPSAIGYFGRAAEAEPSSWRHQEHLAGAYLRNKDYEQAQTHAERAIELGKDRAGGSQLILAQALVLRNERQRAITTLKSFLGHHPNDSHATAARQLCEILEKAESHAAAPTVVDPELAAPTAKTIVSDLAPPPKWMPPDVDESMPPVEPGVACPLQQVQSEAAKRVHDFIDAANKITATEKLDNEVLDSSGFAAVRESRTYTYVASITEIRPNMLDLQEYRNGSMDPEIFPQHIATIGLPSLVLVFHPDYIDDFDLECEGLSRWHGGLAWQVHFRQKLDKPSRLREYRLGGHLSPVPLRGLAWIATDTYQVISLETDILFPMPEIRLNAEHISIDYGPVQFHKYNQKLWLPQTAELYLDFNGRHMHRRHHFSSYLLFAVDEKEKISDPKIKSETDPTASSPEKKP